ncbi:hypothetical protein [Streptomyces sp. NPDC005438]|uniref:hypothetical protein n=1 Tax=Streptomyces sp. NPDC005438 TaxID=3156880 RepID=UPI0033A31511
MVERLRLALPPPAREPADPLLAGLANAALPGAGYALMGRRLPAALALLGTVTLLTVVYTVASPWCDLLLLLFWAAGIAHGAWLARTVTDPASPPPATEPGTTPDRSGEPPAADAPAAEPAAPAEPADTPAPDHHETPPDPAPTGQPQTGQPPVGPRRRIGWQRPHLIWGGAALVVLLLAGFLRFDGLRVADQVRAAHQDGDCPELTGRQSELWFGTRLADAPDAARGDRLARSCDRLRAASRDLRTGLRGDTGALERGFRTLSAVLPGNRAITATTLDTFLGQVSGRAAREPCDTAAVTRWLWQRERTGDLLDRSTRAAARTVPAALRKCGDSLMEDDAWAKARARYQEVVDHHPDSTQAKAARAGVTRATHALELRKVRGLLTGGYGDALPRYCDEPARYSAAAPYRKGHNRALVHGGSKYTGKLPGGWRTTDPTKATTVVCVGEEKNGDSVGSCLYEKRKLSSFPYKVTFRRIKLPVKVYELRTGKLVADRKIQISGSSCPRVLRYETYGTDIGPPSNTHVTPSRKNVRDALRPLLKP